MSKDAIIEIPCAHLEMRAVPPEEETEKVTLHFVPVPAEALAEVQEVLKKYQPQMERFNELLSKAIQAKRE